MTVACEVGKRPEGALANDPPKNDIVPKEPNDVPPVEPGDVPVEPPGGEGVEPIEPIAPTKSIQVFAKNIVVDCTSGKRQEWSFSANTLNISDLDWKFSPDIAARGFKYAPGNKGIGITANLDAETCLKLLEGGETVTVKACDASDPTVCGSATFTVGAELKRPPQPGLPTATDAIKLEFGIPGTVYKWSNFKKNVADKIEDEATCYVPDIWPTSEAAIPGPQNMAGVTFTGYNFGDTVVFRVQFAKGRYTAEIGQHFLWHNKVVGEAHESDYENTKFTNDTWRIVEDPYSKDLVIIGALIYKHDAKELTNTPNPMWSGSFGERLLIKFKPVKGGPCDGHPEREETLDFAVAPPALNAAKLMDTNIDVRLYSENLSGSDFWLYMEKESGVQIVTKPIYIDEDKEEEHVMYSPKYLCQPQGSPVTDFGIADINQLSIGTSPWHECTEDDSEKSKLFLSDIAQVNIQYFYREKCGKADWDVKLNYISISNDYVYSFTGYDKDYDTEVDGDNGCGTHVSEKVEFDMADHPWQLRCDPKLPQAYWDKLGYYKVKDQPAGPVTKTCGEELGD